MPGPDEDPGGRAKSVDGDRRSGRWTVGDGRCLLVPGASAGLLLLIDCGLLLFAACHAVVNQVISTPLIRKGRACIGTTALAALVELRLGLRLDRPLMSPEPSCDECTLRGPQKDAL